MSSAVINQLQDLILKSVGPVPNSQSFYLTGGTALARFYLHHRQSRDLDFFTDRFEFIIPFSQNLEGSLKGMSLHVERQRETVSFVELVVSDQNQKTLIHIAQDSSFRFEKVKQFQDYPGLNVDDLTDIASNKLLALFGRAAFRDFIDVYYLITRSGFSRDQLADLAKQKDPGFDLYWLMIAFRRIETFNDKAPDLLLVLEEIPFEDFRRFFLNWSETIAKKLEILDDKDKT